MTKKVYKMFIALLLIAYGILMVILGTKIKGEKGFLSYILLILVGIFVLIYLINLIIYLRNHRRRKIDANKLEENVIKKKQFAEENYNGYYRTVTKHLIWGDLYIAFIIFLLLVAFSIICMIAKPSNGYFVFLAGALLFFTISFAIGNDLPPYDPAFELNEEEYPHLWDLIRKVAKEYQVKKHIKCYFCMDCNASVNESNKGCTIFLGVILLQLLNMEELESILNHEFAHVVNKDTKRTYSLLKKLEKWMGVVDSKEGFKLLLSILFSPLSNILSNDYQLFDYVSRRTVERVADLAIKDRANSQFYINAIAKISLYSFFETEEAYPVNEVYELDNVTDQYFTILYNKFCEYYNQNQALWNELIIRRIPAQVESHLTFQGRMELLGINDFQVFFDEPISEFASIVKRANDLIVKNIEPSYEERRKREYLEPLNMIEQFEAHPEELDRLELFSVARGYRNFHKFDQAMAVYEEILKDNPDHPQVLFEKGTLLLSMFNMEGIDFIYQAMSLNPNYLDMGVNLIGEYCLKMGLKEELEKYRQYRREMANYFFNVHLNTAIFPNDRLVSTSLPKEVLVEVVQHLKVDYRVDKIFVADKIIDQQNRTTVIGYTIKKDYREQLVDLHEWIFDYLDNDRREQYTLLSLDENPFFFKKFEAIKDSIHYQSY